MSNTYTVSCNNTSCDHNTGFTNECMWGVTEELIERAKSGAPMCDVLRAKILWRERHNE